MLAAVLSVFTAVAAVVPAAAVEGTVSQHYDGEIKGQGQSIEYKFGIGISGDFEFTVGGALGKYGIQFYDATGISMRTKAVIQESLPINSIFQPAHIQSRFQRLKR